MLFHLLPDLADVQIVFNLFRFITFRAAGALVTSLVLAFALGPMTIRVLKRFRIGQGVRAEGPATPLPKAGTRTVTMAEGATMTEAQASRIVEDAGFTLGGFEEVQAQASTRHE